jgi:uncharacterized membrane protein YGL010W
MVYGRGMMTGYGWVNQHQINMNNLLNIVIVLLVVGWLIGFIGFGAMVGSLIHILIVLAVIGLLFRLFAGRRSGV